MAGIKDVAKKAGVGVGTVSRMLNDSGYVAEETRKKIELAMKELNYTPNELARNLYRMRTGIIAVLVPSVSYPFFAEFVDYVEAELYKLGFKMMLCNTSKEKNAELEYLDMLDRHIVDGVITGVHSLDVKEYKKMHKPIVALDRFLGEHIPVVTADHRQGARLAAEALIGSGCKRVLHFRASTAVQAPYLEKHTAFDQMMKEKHIQTYHYEIEWNRFDLNYYREIAEDICSGKLKFDGVFGVDCLVIACMNEFIRKRGKVPEEVRFVAYDGTFAVTLMEPKPTVVVQPIAELAREAVQILNDMMNGKEYRNKQVVLDVQCRKGDTTAV